MVNYIHVIRHDKTHKNRIYRKLPKKWGGGINLGYSLSARPRYCLVLLFKKISLKFEIDRTAWESPKIVYCTDPSSSSARPLAVQGRIQLFEKGGGQTSSILGKQNWRALSPHPPPILSYWKFPNIRFWILKFRFLRILNINYSLYKTPGGGNYFNCFSPPLKKKLPISMTMVSLHLRHFRDFINI